VSDIIFSDFTGGVQNRDECPVGYPQNALVGGENFEILPRGMKVRPGSSITSSGELPDGTIRMQKQVRFPGTGATYIVAQVEGGTKEDWTSITASGDPPLPQYCKATAWIPSLHLLVAFYFTTQVEVWSFCEKRLAWTDITPSVVPSSSPGYATHFGGPCVVGTKVWMLDGDDPSTVGYFDVTTELFTWVSSSGDTPTTQDTGPTWYRESDGCMYMWDAENLFGGMSPAIYKLSLADYTWTLTEFNAIPIYNTAGWTEAGYALIDDVFYSVAQFDGTGGADPIVRIYKIAYESTSTWTAMTDIDELSSGEFGLYGGTVSTVVDEKIYLWEARVDEDQDSNQTLFTRTSIYDPTSNALATTGWPSDVGSAVSMSSQKVAVTDDGGVYFLGGTYWWGDVRHYLSMQLNVIPEAATSSLYASPTHLPATTMTWYKIDVLGAGSGVCSVDTLGDAAIITEGTADVPLVWRGGLETDGSDWASPITVLLSQDGQYYADVSDPLCDWDTTTVVDIGGLAGTGELAIRTDVPEIESLYLEMGTPNTNSSTATLTGSRAIVFADADAVLRHDLRDGLISYWKQSSGVAGNFEGDALSLDDDDVLPHEGPELSLSELPVYPHEGPELSLDAAAVVDHGGGVVEIPYTAHALTDGAEVRIYGTTNYNGSFTLETGTTGQNYLLITATFVVETLGAGAKCKLNLADGMVQIPYVAHALTDGAEVRIYGTTNYNGFYTLEVGSTGQNFLLITETFVAETLTGTAKCRLNLADGKVQIPYASHALTDAQTVRIYGTSNYNGTYVLETGTTSADFLLITDTFVSETLSGASCRVRPTLGTGNDCIYVEAGAFCTIDGTDYRIASITDDGEADGEVTLSSAASSEDCSEIFTVGDGEDGNVSVEHSYATLATTMAASVGASWWDLRKTSVRMKIPASAISTSGAGIKIALRSGNPYYTIQRMVPVTTQQPVSTTTYTYTPYYWCLWEGPGSAPDPPIFQEGWYWQH